MLPRSTHPQPCHPRRKDDPQERPLPGAGKAALEKLIESEHNATESAIHEEALKAHQRDSPPPSSTPPGSNTTGSLRRGSRLTWGQYEHAIELWEQALSIGPGDKALEINLGIAKKKAGKGSTPKSWVIGR